MRRRVLITAAGMLVLVACGGEAPPEVAEAGGADADGDISSADIEEAWDAGYDAGFADGEAAAREQFQDELDGSADVGTQGDDAPDADARDTFDIGETATIGDYEVTVTEFVADATDRVLGDNQFNEDPDNGLYGTVTFDATYVGDDEGHPGMDITARLVIAGVQHADYECGASVEGGGMDAPQLERGGTATDITFCFDHPGLDGDARLFLEDAFSFDGDRAYWTID
jgi:hypothetical protein